MAATPYLRISCPAALEDDVVAELWSAGSSGVEVRGVPGLMSMHGAEPRAAEGKVSEVDEQAAPGVLPETIELVAYFEDPVTCASFELAPRWDSKGVDISGRGDLEARDWLEEYRRFAQPIEVGQRFLLDPREPDLGSSTAEVRSEGGRRRLNLPARGAFGTGSHETTRLVLLELEALADEGRVRGRRVLDVGTGTGVLAFAAIEFGAARVVGFDIDPAAPFYARDNARRNGFAASADAAESAPVLAWFGGTVDSLGTGAQASFDLLLVNILPHRILHQAKSLLPLLAEGGVVLYSGVPTIEDCAVRDSLERAGFLVVAERREGDWLAYRCVSADSAAGDPPAEGPLVTQGAMHGESR